MKHHPRRTLQISLLAAGVLAFAFICGCGTTVRRTERQTQSTAPGPVARRTGASVESGDDLPLLGSVTPFALTDQDGQRFRTEQLRGKVWIATFIFTRCGSTCPRQSIEFARLQQRLQDGSAKDALHLVTFTVDPGFDSPAVLASYAERFGADTSGWTFLTGSREELWRLCKDDFHLPVSPGASDTNELIVHSTRFALVDGESNLRGYYDGLSRPEVAKLVRDARRLLDSVQPSRIGLPSQQQNGKTASTPNAQPLKVRITGRDFEWFVRYPGGDGLLDTADDVVKQRDLHLPSYTDVVLELRSEDYLYSLALPDMQLKEIAVPDLVFTLQFNSGATQTSKLLGDQMCGYAHTELIGKLVVEPATRFWEWLEMPGSGEP